MALPALCLVGKFPESLPERGGKAIQLLGDASNNCVREMQCQVLFSPKHIHYFGEKLL